jgi:hypothetical protein
MPLFAKNYNALISRWSDLEAPAAGRNPSETAEPEARTCDLPADEPVMTPPEPPYRPWLVPGRNAI